LTVEGLTPGHVTRTTGHDITKPTSRPYEVNFNKFDKVALQNLVKCLHDSLFLYDASVFCVQCWNGSSTQLMVKNLMSDITV